MLANSTLKPCSSSWIPESRASFYVRLETLQIFSITSDEPKKIYVGNGEGLPILDFSLHEFLLVPFKIN